MQGRFLEVIEFQPRSARWLAWFAAGMAAPAAWAVAGAALPPGWKLVLAAVALVTMAVPGCWRPRHSLYVASALLHPAGQWELRPGDGSGPLAASLRRSWGERHGPVLALEWSCADGRTRRAWLTPLDVPAGTWRRLRVRLGMA